MFMLIQTDHIEYENHLNLWQAVLAQAIRDLTAKGRYGKKDSSYCTSEYFQNNNQGFVNICKVLGCEPEEIIKRVNKI